MPMIFRIAFRNLGEHKVKSSIIVGLVAFGMLLLVLSSSVLETAKIGIEKSFTKNFSGHILIGPKGPNGEAPNMFPGSGFSLDTDGPRTINDYEKTFKAIAEWQGVTAVNPQVFGAFQMELNELWVSGGGAFSFNTDMYQKIFPGNITMIAGKFLEDGDEGILVSQRVVSDFKKKSMDDFLPAVKARLDEKQKSLSDGEVKQAILDGSIALLPEESAIVASATIDVGTELKLTGFTGGARIKRAKVLGIYTFNSTNSTIESFSIIDLSSMRYMNGMIVGAASVSEVDPGIEAMFDSDASSEDDFFGEGFVTESSTSSKVLTEADFDNVIGDTTAARELNKPDAGAWHYILVRVGEGISVEKTIADMNAWFASENEGLQAVNWETAAGQVAQLVSVVQIGVSVLIGIIVVISVIIIMNTMVASIIERTGEIGTMRALGAQKDFVREVFMAESITLSAVGGFIGLLIAGIIIAVFNVLGLPAGNELLELLFGGKVLYPVISFQSVISALVIILAVGLAASLYPTLLAMRVPPIKAMQSN